MKTARLSADHSASKGLAESHWPEHSTLRRWVTVTLELFILVVLFLIMLVLKFPSPRNTEFRILGHAALTPEGLTCPSSALIEDRDGYLYGTMAVGGMYGEAALFRMTPDGASFQILHTFAGGREDGAIPDGGVILGPDGALLGTTADGGAWNRGLVFRIGTDGDDYRVLHSFGGISEDGATPHGGLSGGPRATFYGTTYQGGSNGLGTVFRIHADGTGYRVLHHFGNTDDDSSQPWTSVVIGNDRALYGTTTRGGAYGLGTVYRLEAEGGEFSILHSFGDNVMDGAKPLCKLLARRGTLYGTTTVGGRAQLGTVFKLNEDGSGYAVLHHFQFSEGAYPLTGLVEGRDGRLYGVAANGGNAFGTVFRLNRDGSRMHIIHTFDIEATGTGPCFSLLVAADGTLYGTAPDGGHGGSGTIFCIQTTTRRTLKRKFSRLWQSSPPRL